MLKVLNAPCTVELIPDNNINDDVQTNNNNNRTKAKAIFKERTAHILTTKTL